MRVLTTITSSYDYSAELRLFLSMFRQKLPGDSHLSILNRSDDDEASDVLRNAIAAGLAEGSLPEYLLVVKEPTLFLQATAVTTIRKVLDRDARLDCVLPSDIRGYRTGHQATYLTLRSFERFARGLQDRAPETTGYDGREPFLFLVRTAALQHMDLPRNIFAIPGILGDRTAISLNGYIHPFFDYYMEKREELLPLVPEAVGSVLDIGCARGGFGAALKAVRRCRVVGIEMNPTEGQKARQILDGVIIGDVLQVAVNEQFDCVTCLDILEHFADPANLLQRIRNEFLRQEGYLVVSIPNVGHWSVVEDLLAGRWDYLPVGLLCTTHLRFFTSVSIQEFLEQSGFKVKKSEVVRVPMPDMLRRTMEALATGGMEIDIQSLEALTYNILACRVT
jgi:2-polyprenyl-3-methyl-5-hydroxy-6-metoxy-1,4-benzoquinol methylase